MVNDLGLNFNAQKNDFDKKHDEIKEEKFFKTIPEYLKNIVSPYGESQWELLQAILKFGYDFKSLVATSPTTAFLILHIDRLNPTYSCYANMTYLLGLAGKKQKELLGLALFPKTNQMVKILNKINQSALSLNLLIEFRDSLKINQSLNSELFKFLSHFKSDINLRLMIILAKHIYVFDVLSPKAINQLLNSDNFEYDMLRLRELAKSKNTWRKYFDLIDEINNLKEKEKLIKKRLKEIKKKMKQFPAPPIEDNEYVKAIRTVDELKHWSKNQKNCVRNGGYIRQIKQGSVYIYKVTSSEEEATLEINIYFDSLSIGQLKGKGNKSVPKLRGIVNEWFNTSKRIKREDKN